MPPRRKPQFAEQETDAAELQQTMGDLRDEIRDLKQTLTVLINAIDEIREELAWLTRNGLPPSEPKSTLAPVVKRMALDPCDPNWAAKLEFASGVTAGKPIPRDHAPPAGRAAPSAVLPDIQPTQSPSASARPIPPRGKLFIEPGDQGQLF